MCAVLVAARDEAQMVSATLAALASALPGARLWVADDGSRDATARLAAQSGARVVGGEGARRGKGAAMSAAARAALEDAGAGADDGVFILCDADLGDSAARLVSLAAALGPLPGAAQGGAPERIAVAVFARREGGGLGIALAFARFALAHRAGPALRAPMSGQRALRGRTLRRLLPFADGFGMELGMALDAERAGIEVVEVELNLSHRVRGRTPAGFAHRGRQLVDMLSAYRRR